MSFQNNTCTGDVCADKIRYVHHISIGVDKTYIPPYEIDDAATEIMNRITLESCGVTCFRAQGTWLPPEKFCNNKSSDIERNDAINFILSLDANEQYLTWKKIKQIISEEVINRGLGCRYIHVMMWPAEARIFEVGSALGEAAS